MGWLSLRDGQFKIKDFRHIISVENGKPIKGNPQRYQHVISWTWKCLDFNRLCSKPPRALFCAVQRFLFYQMSLKRFQCFLSNKVEAPPPNIECLCCVIVTICHSMLNHMLRNIAFIDSTSHKLQTWTLKPCIYNNVKFRSRMVRGCFTVI